MEPFQFQNHPVTPYFSLSPWGKYSHLKVGFSARTHENQNYALHVGDCPEQVLQNREKLAKTLTFPFSSWTCGEQVHGVNIEIVQGSDGGKGRLSRDTALLHTDGLITQESDILLASFYADCVPLYFYATDIDTVGIAHAGWKGTVQGIGGRMVDQLLQLGAALQHILVAIGPSIDSCCYEVDDQVMEPLQRSLSNDKILHQVALPQPNQPNRWRIDLKEINAFLLNKAGLTSQQIVKSKWCTSCDTQYFYSHRRDRGKTGRMVAFVGKQRR